MHQVREKKGGGNKRERPEKGRDNPQETVEEPESIWFRDRGTALR